MSDYDWNRYQNQLDTAAPRELNRERSFLEGMTPAEVDRQNQMLTGTQDAAAGYAGAQMDAQNEAEQRRVDLWEDRGLHAWEIAGTQGPSQVQAPQSSPAKAATQSPQMLGQLIQAATSAKNVETQSKAQVMSAAISAGASGVGSFLGSDATKYSADASKEVGLSQVEQQKVANGLRERELIVNAERLRTMSTTDLQKVAIEQFRVYADQLPKFKLKTFFGEITGHQSNNADLLMAWSRDRFNNEDMPPFFAQLSNDALQELVNKNMSWVDSANNLGNLMNTAGEKTYGGIMDTLKHTRDGLGFLKNIIPK